MEHVRLESGRAVPKSVASTLFQLSAAVCQEANDQRFCTRPLSAADRVKKRASDGVSSRPGSIGRRRIDSTSRSHSTRCWAPPAFACRRFANDHASSGVPEETAALNPVRPVSRRSCDGWIFSARDEPRIISDGARRRRSIKQALIGRSERMAVANSPDPAYPYGSATTFSAVTEAPRKIRPITKPSRKRRVLPRDSRAPTGPECSAACVTIGCVGFRGVEQIGLAHQAATNSRRAPRYSHKATGTGHPPSGSSHGEIAAVRSGRQAYAGPNE